MTTTFTTRRLSAALAVSLAAAGPADVAVVLGDLAARTGAFPADRGDRDRAARIGSLACWLHAAALERAPGPAATDVLVHGLLIHHQMLLARHRAEMAPFLDDDGSLLGEDYADYDETADRHTKELLELLEAVMASLAGLRRVPGCEAPRPHPNLPLPRGGRPKTVRSGACTRCGTPVELYANADGHAWFDAGDDLQCPDGQELHTGPAERGYPAPRGACGGAGER